MRNIFITLFLAASAAIQAADSPVAAPDGQTRKTKPGFAKTVATDQASSKSSSPSAADERDKQVRTALEGFFAAGTKAWNGREFEAARAEFRRALAMADAPAHFRSYAHLRIAQSYAAEKNAAAAMAEYGRIKAEAAYPEIHRLEAGECLAEFEREGQGLPARDPTASRTKIPPVTAFAAEFFVAPDGSDEHPGTREKPLATLEKARDTIRKLKAQGLPGPVGVRLLPGEYRVKSTFELTADDSGTDKAPVVYRADKQGTAVLYGGTRLTGFAPLTDPAVVQRIPEEAKGKVFQCDLKQAGVTDYGPLTERGYGVQPPPATLELFFNGQPMRLARWPNDGFVNGGTIFEPGSKKDGKPSVFEYLDDRHARWANAADGWLFGYFRHGWADRTLKIQSIDPASKRVACGPYEQGGFGMEPVKWFNKGKVKYSAFNLLEELDQPGEWYLDRQTGILYFYPPSDPVQATVEVGLLTVPMLSLANAAHVRVEGLVFDLSRSSGLLLRDCENCLIAGCTVKRLAGTGIRMTGGRENGIFGCDLYSLGRRATEVIGGDRRTLTPGKHFVENCWMHSFGRLDHTYVPGVQLEGCGNRVAHNLMGDCPSSVVRFEGNDHVLEYNRVYRALLESEDQGAMETFGNPTYRGVVFRHNHFSELGPRDHTEGPAGRAGIRLDDAISGMLIYGNIFHRAAQGFGGIQINGGRDNLIDNNLFAECEKGISGGYNARNDWWARVNTAPAFTVTDLYLERYPDLRRLGTEPAWNSAWRNVFWKCGPTFNTYGRPSADKFDRLANAEYADGDPGFVDALNGDFRFQPDALLFSQVGFRPIPMDEIGLYAHPLRASWPADMPAATHGGRLDRPEAEISATTPASAAAPAMIKPWTLAQRDGRQCLLTPAGQPFMILGLSHASGAWQAEDGVLTSEEKVQRLATLKQDLRDLRFNAVDYVEFIRELPAGTPGRARYEAWQKKAGPSGDAAFLVLIARELYTATAAAYREFAPGRLLFGERYNTIPGAPLEIIAECGKVVDVLSFQPYEKTLKGDILDQVYAMTGKPILLSDWSLSFPIPGHPNTMWPQFPTDDEAAQAYEAYLVSAFAKPYILGYYKCQYRDAVLAGGQLKQGLRGVDGELRDNWARHLARIHKTLLATLAEQGG